MPDKAMFDHKMSNLAKTGHVWSKLVKSQNLQIQFKNQSTTATLKLFEIFLHIQKKYRQFYTE